VRERESERVKNLGAGVFGPQQNISNTCGGAISGDLTGFPTLPKLLRSLSVAKGISSILDPICISKSRG